MVSARQRGLTYWESTDGTSVVLLSIVPTIFEIDAAIGKLDLAYDVDLKLGLERDPEVIFNVQSVSPPRVWHDMLLWNRVPGKSMALQ